MSRQYLVQPVVRRVLLLLDTEEVQHHGHGEEDGGEEEQDLLLGLERRSEEGVSPVQPTQSVAHRASKTWNPGLGEVNRSDVSPQSVSVCDVSALPAEAAWMLRAMSCSSVSATSSRYARIGPSVASAQKSNTTTPSTVRTMPIGCRPSSSPMDRPEGGRYEELRLSNLENK